MFLYEERKKVSATLSVIKKETEVYLILCFKTNHKKSLTSFVSFAIHAYQSRTGRSGARGMPLKLRFYTKENQVSSIVPCTQENHKNYAGGITSFIKM